MNKFVRFALAALVFSGIASAQNVPAVDVFGGYSYLNFKIPEATGFSSEQDLKFNGWEASAAVALFHHLSAEADFSGHQLTDCGGVSGLKCDNFSYMFGPRYTFGDRASRFTFFVHGLVGRDHADFVDSSGTDTAITDTSISVAAGGGLDLWFMRHVGVQVGPVDFVYANHLNEDGAPHQTTYRAAGGIVFRFGGDFPAKEEKAPKPPKEKEEAKKEKSEGHRSWKRPWHKNPSSNPETEGSNQPVPVTSAPPEPREPQPRQSTPSAPTELRPTSRGMPVRSLGVTVAPQEFDGARVLEIEPGSIAEMASLHVGDMIKSVDGKAVRTPMELAAELADKSGKVRIGFTRGGVLNETVILLGK
jgi:PDZ domain